MALEKLTYAPERAGYAIQHAPETVGVKLEGGLSRVRKDIIDGAELVNVQWRLNGTDYNAFWLFIKQNLNNGADRFSIDLFLKTNTLLEYTAQFVPGTLRLQQQRGDSYTLVAQLEVLPTATNLGPGSLGSVLFEPADGDYLSWDFRASADDAASAATNEGPFYPQIGSVDWSVGTQGDSAASTEWTFPSGEWEWEKTAPKGLQCLSDGKSSMALRYANSNTSPLRPILWPDNDFFYVEFFVQDLDKGGPSDTEDAILYSAPFNGPASKEFYFGMDEFLNLYFNWGDGAGNGQELSTSGNYTMTVPFTGHVGFAIHAGTDEIVFFVDGVEVDRQSLVNYSGMTDSDHAERAHLGVEGGDARNECPKNCLYQVWNLYKIPVVSLVSDWETNIVSNNYTYWANLLGL